MNKGMADQIWSTLALAHEPKSKHWVPRHFYAALRVDWRQLTHRDYRAIDPHERLLREILLHNGSDPQFFKRLQKALQERPHAPADALSQIYRKFPVLASMVVLSHHEMSRALELRPDLLKELVPDDWSDKLHHAVDLLMSIKIWLKAIELCRE